MKKFKFTEDEYAKLADSINLPMMEVQRLDAMGLLNNSVAVKIVLQWEYDNAIKQKAGVRHVIIKAIALKYGLTTSQVGRILYDKEHPVYYCQQCNKEVDRREYRLNKGLCSDCAVGHVQL